ncbi:hypothetical protein PanWU01x14_065340, partial [Parasponia andersonii]
ILGIIVSGVLRLGRCHHVWGCSVYGTTGWESRSSSVFTDGGLSRTNFERRRQDLVSRVINKMQLDT